MYKLPADFEAVKRHLIRVRFLEEFLSSIKIDPPDIVSVYFSMTLDIKKDRPSLFIIGFSTNAMKHSRQNFSQTIQYLRPVFVWARQVVQLNGAKLNHIVRTEL